MILAESGRNLKILAESGRNLKDFGWIWAKSEGFRLIWAKSEHFWRISVEIWRLQMDFGRNLKDLCWIWAKSDRFRPKSEAPEEQSSEIWCSWRTNFDSCLNLMINSEILSSDTNCKSQKHVMDLRINLIWIKGRKPMSLLWELSKNSEEQWLHSEILWLVQLWISNWLKEANSSIYTRVRPNYIQWARPMIWSIQWVKPMI